MSKQKGLTFIELMFVIVLISVFSIGIISIFLMDQKMTSSINDLNKMKEQHLNFASRIKYNIGSDFNSFSYKDDGTLTINQNNEFGCDNTNISTYEIKDELLVCNDKIISSQIIDFEIKTGYDTTQDGAIDTYSQTTSEEGVAKALILETIVRNDTIINNDKEHKLNTLSGEQSFKSDYRLQIFRSTLTNKEAL